MLTINKFDPSIAIAVFDKKAKLWEWNDKQKMAFINCYFDLPPGDWHLLFKGSEATDTTDATVYQAIRSYMKESDINGIGSFYDILQKMLRANGIHLTPQQDVIILKNEKR